MTIQQYVIVLFKIIYYLPLRKRIYETLTTIKLQTVYFLMCAKDGWMKEIDSDINDTPFLKSFPSPITPPVLFF